MNIKKIWLLCSAALSLSYAGAYANSSASVDVNRTETTVSTTSDDNVKPYNHHHRHMRTARSERWSREDVTFVNERRFPPLTDAELREAKLKLLSSKLPDNERMPLQAQVDRTEWIIAHQGDTFRTRHYARLDNDNGRFERYESTTDTTIRHY